ncbi:uncharacterized protein LOC107641291 [Arachis ipaensis]|uniref:uncharacterized protein LOC107641291 n=1 Tax=Arachis ipaensis TaxID=130454 RepID=UPI0007AF1368|nr:uncharacterized protein LOC107641291 [Arachis ipaensis]
MAVEWDDMEAEVLADEKLNGIMQKLLVGEKTIPDFALMNGKLKYKGRLVLAKTSKWIPKILMEFHSSKLGGHSGFFRTYKRMSAILYWEGGLPKVKRMDTKFVVVDHMTKYAHFFPLSHPFTAKDVAVLFIKEVETSSFITRRDGIFSGGRNGLIRGTKSDAG